METNKTCPSCGKPIGPDAPQGLCPACLMKVGAGSFSVPADGTVAQTGGFEPPSIEDLARLFPQLEVLEPIGKGGMGAVYKARQKDLDRLVALKVLPVRAGTDPGFTERFTREARALARLSHPNIVAVYEFGQVDSLHYFIMEYVDGTNLRQVERSGGLEPKQALAIIPQICEALQFAHDKGIVHRDIKPENILLDREGHVKIADFGLAKILGQRQDLTLTAEGHIMGTPHYMAPEQVEHPQAVDHRADIYSLGVVFYEMLTGELPLGKFAPPSRKVQIDVRLDEVVLRTLEKEPDRRYQQASQVRTEVETIISTPEPKPKPHTPPALTPEDLEDIRGRLRIPGFGIFLVGVIDLCFLVVMFLANRMRPDNSLSILLNVLGLFVALLLLAIPVVILIGGSHIRRLKNYRLAVLATILAMIVPPGAGIGLPFGIWTLILLSRSEVREAFETKRMGRGVSKVIEFVGPSRFSRKAIFGICWAPLFCLGVVPVWIFWEASHVHGVGLGSMELFLLAMIMLPGITAPFGTTILGWVAVAEIRRAGGRLYGLGLALFDGLLFPLLLLDVLIVCVGLVSGLRGFAGVILALPVDAVIVWLAWRAVKNPLESTGPAPSTPTLRKRRVGHLVLAGFVGLIVLGLTALFVFQDKGPADGSAADSPTMLRRLTPYQVLEAGLSKPQSPWAWQELEQRAQSGRLGSSEARVIVEGLTAWIRRDYPNGYTEPLYSIEGLLRELDGRGLVREGHTLGFLEAFYGTPLCHPSRIREGKPTLMLTCTWRSPWYQDLLGMNLLNEMRTINIDDRPVAWRSVIGKNWGQHEFYGELELPELDPGRHVVRCEVQSALVSKSEMTGLASDVPSKDWPPARRRWIRACQADLAVFARDAVIVGLTQGPALDPVASGGLSVGQVIIRRKGPLATAVVSFRFSDTLQVPISFDVALRVGDRIIPCGRIWRNKRPDGRVESGGDQRTADLEPLDPQIREADVLLTPNPQAVENVPSIDRIWGREITFSRVPLIRQDLQEVGVRFIDTTAPGQTNEPMELDLDGETMQNIVTVLRQRYPVRLCLENLDFDKERDGITIEQAIAQLEGTAKVRPLSDKESRRLATAHQLLQEGRPKEMLFDCGPRYEGRIAADTVEGFLAQLTQDTPYDWRRIDDTYVVCPRGQSRLMFPVTLKTDGLTVEQAVGKVLDQDTSGSKMGLSVTVAKPVKDIGEGPCPWLRAKAPALDLHEVPAMTALCRITAGARPASVWELAGYRDGRGLSLAPVSKPR